MHEKNIVSAGADISSNGNVIIMIHGRGASASDILGLAGHLELRDYALLAPQATNNTWYPFSFMAPRKENEPWLSSALALLEGMVKDLLDKGVSENNIHLLGFSQGACLALEFAAMHARQYGGVIAFTGGLIGHKLDRQNYTGSFHNAPIFIGSSDPDPHVPVERVLDTVRILKEMDASVTQKIYPQMGHTINQDEIDMANSILRK